MALAELDSGEHAIVPGDPSKSALLQRVANTDDGERMPPEGKPLSAEQVSLLERWIAGGAPWKDHWAFEPIARPESPRSSTSTWGRNPIDDFIREGLEDRGLAPNPPAEPVALLRRLYFDLIGLPPKPEEVDAFLADPSDAAYEQVVDRLLASPRHGEKWARHWLDLVRYADTNSFERDGVKPNAWRYRDYVIRSFNDDKPFDQFTREQLAGDELDEVTTDTLTATAYFRLGLWDDEPADKLQARYDELDDIVATTGQVFLGLTVNCARCHDHKLDPIPQADYYRLLAFFHEIPPYKPDACQMDISPPEIAQRHREVADQLARLKEKMAPLEQEGIAKMPAEDQRKSEGPERERLLRQKLKDHLTPDAWNLYSSLKQELKVLEKTPLPPRETVLGIGPCLDQPPPTHVLLRGNPHVNGPVVEPAFLAALGGGTPAVTRARASSGRRRALADWITAPGNPLAARVWVNRLWQHHFGRGIVRSSNNFGSLGNPPTHPELLDWLASRLIDEGWRTKPLHKAIVMSETYRMSSAANDRALAVDPENDQFWRFDMRRLSAEEIRDALLAFTGTLNLKMYGPGVFPKLSPEVLTSQSMPGNGWGDSPPEEQARRSIYIHQKRSLVVPILAEFDICDSDTSCSNRFSTTQPTQALGMLHGDFSRQMAAAFAARLTREVPGDLPGQVRRSLRLALARPADSASVERNLALIDRLQRQHGVSPEKALEVFALSVLNLNETVYLE